MDKIKIFVACHRPCTIKQDKMLIPIHVGRAISYYKEEMSDMLGDDTGENISKKNPQYCELTAQYWVWKNYHDAEYVGFCHYRRFFNLNISESNVNSLFGTKDVILLGYHNMEMVERSMLRSISLDNITIFLMVLKKMYPEYEQTVLDYLWSNIHHGKNMLICRKQLFDQYAEWIFGILKECENYIKLSPYSREQRVFAYLAEYFMPVFFIHNAYNIYTVPVSENDLQSNFAVRNYKDIVRNMVFHTTRLFFKKPKSFEDYYSESVVLGLRNDGIIQAMNTI